MKKCKRIIVIGNMGSGKSSLSKKLAKEYDIPDHCIDEFRIKYIKNRWTKKREKVAWDMFSESVRGNSCVYETCSTGYFDRNYNHMRDDSIVIYLRASKDVCFKRKYSQFLDPTFQKAPFFSEPTSNNIRNNIEVISKCLDGVENKSDHIIDVDDMSVDEIYLNCKDVVKEFMNKELS